MKGPFIGTFFSKKLTWVVEGLDFSSEWYDPKTSTCHLSASRLGLNPKFMEDK